LGQNIPVLTDTHSDTQTHTHSYQFEVSEPSGETNNTPV